MERQRAPPKGREAENGRDVYKRQGKELYMVVSGCLVIRQTGKVHGADWHGKIVTFLLYGTAAVHIIWFHITPVSYTHL